MNRVIVSALMVLGAAIVLLAQDGGYDHASTVQEGAARGMADVISAAGQANLMNSEAAKNYEDARKKNIENHLTYTETYFQMKSINEQYRDAHKRPPPTQEQLIRMNNSRRPDRPSSNQVDPLTGEIHWPPALRKAEYQKERDQIDSLYAKRTQNGQLSSADYLEIKRLTATMLAELQRQGSQLPGKARIDARKLLEGLAYEAGLQAS